MTLKRLPYAIVLRVFCRSFLLQASWNFERLQNLGFFYVVAPAMRFFYREEELAAVCRRHLEYFNTHPYMASVIVGATLNLEGKRAAGEEGAMGAGEFKEMVMAPYAAIGDAFFWGGMRPLAACAALFLAVKGSLWAPVVFLLIFNLPHLWFRILGLWRGNALGMKVVQVVQGHQLPDLAFRAKEATVVMLGGLCAFLTVDALRRAGAPPGWGLMLLPALLGLGWLARRGVSVLLLILVIAAFLIGLGIIA